MAEQDLLKIPLNELLAKYPSWNDETKADADAILGAELRKNQRKIIVLDDDPTGVQTVHGISVYTHWTPENIEAGFDESNSLFFILTNSRGMTSDETSKVHADIGKTVAAVARKKNRDFILISRSDSTLRGHYPLETLTLKNTLESETGSRYDGEIICPFFIEGGRYTAGNIHYVKIQDTLVPAAQTEFAADKTFGYRHSDLTEWVEEKTVGSFKKEAVRAVSLEMLRGIPESAGVEAGVEKIASLLMEVEGFNKVIVNALDYNDIKIFCAAFYRALSRGKRFMLRTAAAIPKVLGGVKDKPLLTREELLRGGDSGSPVEGVKSRGGLIVIGSHVQKTSRQLELLMGKKNIVPIEFNTHLVTDDGKFAEEINRVQKLCNESIEAGKTTVVYTCRNRFDLNTGNKEDELRIAVKIAAAITGFVSGLPGRPRFIIAKGGITSSEIGTTALKVKKALVLGQVLPGIPVWLTGSESRFPNTPYIIFPGNVGGEEDLRKIADMLE
jgi:uncharacterized protein YgbK (DUF1537 family)